MAPVVYHRLGGPQPMDLAFSYAEVIAVGLAVILVAQIAGDGQSNWLEGVQLLSVYLILALMFYFLPEAAAQRPSPRAPISALSGK